MVQGETSLALVELYERYSSGRLQKDLQEFLVTDDVRERADTEVVVLVHIDEKEFKEALVDLGREDQVSSKQKDGQSEQIDMLSKRVDMVSEKVDKVLLSLEGKVAPADEKEAKKDEKDMCPGCGKEITQDEIKKHLKEGCPRKGEQESSLEEEITSLPTPPRMHSIIMEEMVSGIAERGKEEKERFPESSAEEMRPRIAKRGKVSATTDRGPKCNKKTRLDQR